MGGFLRRGDGRGYGVGCGGRLTLERGGVNGYSRLPKDPEAYRGVSKPAIEVSPVGPTFGRNGIYATIYSLAMALGRPYFPHYVHHRALSPLPEAFHWVRSGVRKLVYRRLERGMEPKLTGALRGKYFLVPLQVHCDYQLAHSDFESIEACNEAGATMVFTGERSFKH